MGKVTELSLNPETFKARISLDIDSKYNFPLDTAISIGSEGLLGGSFVEIVPGGMDGNLQPNDEIEFTQDAVDMLQLLGKFMFSGQTIKMNLKLNDPIPVRNLRERQLNI